MEYDDEYNESDDNRILDQVDVDDTDHDHDTLQQL